MTVLAALAALSLLAAPTAAPAPEAEVDEIVVEGVRDRAVVLDFVERLARPARGLTLARWDRSVCVRVVNLAPEHAQYMIDRIAVAAYDVGLQPGGPGCRPNVLVLATNDAGALSSALVESNEDLFLGANQLSRESLDRFVATDAPVRWWHASQSRDADTGAPTNWSMVRVRDVSRIRSNVRQDFSHVLVILDVSKIREVPYAALSDYVAMVTLAQIDPQADMTGYSTVLNLFAAKAAGERMPPAMTNWDADYLRAMYTAPRDRRRASQQQRAIATSMTHGY